jgi:outer membrane protein assembly factor BamE (lipoprotein component of BamABCDE complex)
VTVEEHLGDFAIGKTTMDEVLTKCGTPSLLSDGRTWIYVGQKVEEDNLKNVRQTYQFIIRLTFDDNKILQSIDRAKPIGTDAIPSKSEEVIHLISEKRAKSMVDEIVARKHP